MLQPRIASLAVFLISTYVPISGRGFDSGSDLPKMLPLSDDKRIMLTTVGSPFSIRCPVDTKHQTIFIEWSKGRMDLYNKDSEGYTVTERGVLKIRNISKSNAGTYTCNATNGHGSISIAFTLIVEDPQKTDGQKNVNYSSYYSEPRKSQWEAPKIDKPQTLKFKEEVGGAFSIQCSASGYPAPHIFWLKKGGRETTLVDGPGIEIKKTRTRTRSQSSLILHDIREAHGGIYRCLAKNYVGKDLVDYELAVVGPQHPPEILSLTPPDATVMAGHMVVFRCKGKSLPFLNLHIKWLKTIRPEQSQSNRTFYLGSSYYKVLDTDEDPIIANSGQFHSELLILNATQADSGMYVCLAVNDRGYRYKNASLIVVIPPKVTSFFVSSPNPAFVIFVIIPAAVIMAPIMFLMYPFCKCKAGHGVSLTEVEVQLTEDAESHKKRNSSKDKLPCMLKTNQETSKLVTPQATEIYDCSRACQCSLNK